METAKPFKTIDEQIDILLDRGLLIPDTEKAKIILSEHNYYRLSGYTLTLRKNDVFYPGVTFENVLELYFFDMRLRALLFAFLESIEISIRTHIGYYYGKDYGPLGYSDPRNFFPQSKHQEFLDVCAQAVEHSGSEAFIKHHKDKYNGDIPVWVLVETLSFGVLSRFFKAMPYSVQRQIRKNHYPKVPKSEFIAGWLHSLTVLRNVCAHRGRLYNRNLAIPVSFAKEDRQSLNEQGVSVAGASQSVFGYMLCLKRLAHEKGRWKSLLSNIQKLAKEYPFVLLKHYGFPDEWEMMLK